MGRNEPFAPGREPPHLVKATFWIEITSPEDLPKAEQILRERVAIIRQYDTGAKRNIFKNYRDHSPFSW